MGNVSTTAVLNAFTYAGKKGANIINASFGGPNYSSSQYAIIEWLRDKGVCLSPPQETEVTMEVGIITTFNPSYPASYALDNIISVGAVDQEGRLAAFFQLRTLKRPYRFAGKQIYSALPLPFQPYSMTALILAGLVGHKAIYQARFPLTSGRFI